MRIAAKVDGEESDIGKWRVVGFYGIGKAFFLAHAHIEARVHALTA